MVEISMTSPCNPKQHSRNHCRRVPPPIFGEDSSGGQSVVATVGWLRSSICPPPQFYWCKKIYQKIDNRLTSGSETRQLAQEKNGGRYMVWNERISWCRWYALSFSLQKMVVKGAQLLQLFCIALLDMHLNHSLRVILGNIFSMSLEVVLLEVLQEARLSQWLKSCCLELAHWISETYREAESPNPHWFDESTTVVTYHAKQQDFSYYIFSHTSVAIKWFCNHKIAQTGKTQWMPEGPQA